MVEYRVGVIGCGRMAGTIDDEVIGYDACVLPYSHAAAYSTMKNAHVVAAADPNPERLASFCERWKVQGAYSDYKEMIEREGLDIISVTTPATVRHEIVVFAASSGIKAIYCEKAMCCSMSQADEMVEACRRNAVKLNVGTLRRFHPGYLRMRELIEGGRIGEPKVVIAYSSGALMHTHSHTIDTVRFLLGDPKAHYVQGSIAGADYDEVRDELDQDPSLEAGCASFEGGVHAFFVPSPGLYEFEVDCSDGVVRVLDNGIEWRMRVVKEPTDKWRLHAPARFPAFERASPTVKCIEDLIESMQTGRDTRCSASVARDGLEVGLGMALSHIRGGTRMKLPIDDKRFYIPSH